jgi:hypothetical protein
MGPWLPASAWDLSLFAPGILGAPALPAKEIAHGLALPALEVLLSRAIPVPEDWETNESFEGSIFRLFGHPAPWQGDWPVAAVTHALDSGHRDGDCYLRADPVHLRAGMNTLVLVDATSFALTYTEAQALAQEINTSYANEGLKLEVLHPRRWYMRLANVPAVQTYPLSKVVGRELKAYLPQGPDAQRWRKWLNEVQMILHASPINAERTSRGEPPVNSVWLWGGGPLPSVPPSPWRRVWGGDALSQGLARLASIPWSECPESAVPWLRNNAMAGQHLLIIERADGLAQVGDVEGWRDYMRALHREWFVPLQGMLRSGRLSSLTLMTGSGRGFRVTPRLLRRWWRRRQPLQSWLSAGIGR